MTSTTSIRDDTIRTVAEETFKAALSKVGDGSGLIFSSHEAEMDSFQDISSVDPERFANRDYFTSILRKGKTEFRTKDNIKTTISWTQSSCICLNDEFNTDCKYTAAIDILGVQESDNGEYRGVTPVLLMDDDGITELPCLSHSKLPPISDLEVVGCNSTLSRLGPIYSRGLSGPVDVSNCGPESVENLKFISRKTGKVVARSIPNDLIIPINTDLEPDVTMADAIASDEFQINDAIVKYPFIFPPLGIDVVFEFDISKELNVAKNSITKTAFDAIFQGLRLADFYPPDKTASEARVVEFYRVADYFANARLLSSVEFVPDFAKATVQASPLYMSLKGSRPQASSPQEIFSGISLLAIASCGFGAFLGSFIKKKRTKPLIFATVAAFLVLALETIAYSLRWEAEIEQNNFNEAMVLVDVASADRFDGIGVLSIGKDGDTFIANTYTIELEDDGYDHTWAFIVGIIASFLCLVFAYALGPEIVNY